MCIEILFPMICFPDDLIVPLPIPYISITLARRTIFENDLTIIRSNHPWGE